MHIDKSPVVNFFSCWYVLELSLKIIIYNTGSSNESSCFLHGKMLCIAPLMLVRHICYHVSLPCWGNYHITYVYIVKFYY